MKIDLHEVLMTDQNGWKKAAINLTIRIYKLVTLISFILAFT